MEETNYTRHVIASHAPTTESKTPSSPSMPSSDEKTASPQDQEEASSDIESSPSPTTSHTKKTYLDKIKLLRRTDLTKPNRLPGMIKRPLIFLTFPVIFYAGFSYGSNLIWFNVLNGTTSLILGGTYNFPAAMVGLSYLSPLIGVALGSFYTGVLGDSFVLRLARRNKGVLEPEHRLWLFAPSLLLIPFGLILWGVGAAHHIQWFGCVFAMGVIALTNTIGLQLSVSYALDSYKDLGGEAMVTVILVRNTMSFAIGYGVTPWIDGMGLQNAFVVAAMVGMLQCASFFAMVKWGKGLRRASAGRYAKYVNQMAESGLVH